MNAYTFFKLSETVKNCRLSSVYDFGFDSRELVSGFDTFWLIILPTQDDDFLIVFDGTKLFLQYGDDIICQITGADRSNWLELAKTIYEDRYCEQLAKQRKEIDLDYLAEIGKIGNYNWL